MRRHKSLVFGTTEGGGRGGMGPLASFSIY